MSSIVTCSCSILLFFRFFLFVCVLSWYPHSLMCTFHLSRSSHFLHSLHSIYFSSFARSFVYSLLNFRSSFLTCTLVILFSLVVIDVAAADVIVIVIVIVVAVVNVVVVVVVGGRCHCCYNHWCTSPSLLSSIKHRHHDYHYICYCCCCCNLCISESQYWFSTFFLLQRFYRFMIFFISLSHSSSLSLPLASSIECFLVLVCFFTIPQVSLYCFSTTLLHCIIIYFLCFFCCLSIHQKLIE